MKKSTIAVICFCLGVIVCGLMNGCVSIKEHRRVVVEIVDTIVAQNKTIDRLNQRVSDENRLLAGEIDKVRTRVMVQEKVFSDSIAALDMNKADKALKKGLVPQNRLTP